MEDEKKDLTTLFAVRTTIGQEKGVANMIFRKLLQRRPMPDIKVILVSDLLRGYVFLEATHQRDVMESISGVRHVKGKIVGQIKVSDIAHIIVPRRITEVLEEGDIVEIVSGVFQNRRARIERMPREGAREEVTVRLTDSDSPIAIKVHGDFLKLVKKGERREEPAAAVVTEPVAEAVDVFGSGFDEEAEVEEDLFHEVEPIATDAERVLADGGDFDDYDDYEDDEDDDWDKFDDLEEEEDVY
ncbi:MAG: hypothetical protein Kow0069_37330 [Promethearchaeota archaeon]